MEPQQEAQVYQKHLLESPAAKHQCWAPKQKQQRTRTGSVLVQVSVLEAPLGLDVIQDLLQLLVLKATLQAEHTC